MDDLEINPLYQAFLSEFRNIFELACKKCYVIAIPSSECLEEVDIDSTLANHHILVPSRLLKLHYNPLQASYITEIELDNNKLICHLSATKNDLASKLVVSILGEVVGYNQYQTRYRVLIIDKLLYQPQTPPANPNRVSLVKSFLASTFSPVVKVRRDRSRARLKPPRPLLDHASCTVFLESISQHITMDLEADVKRLQSGQLIQPSCLDNVATQVKKLIDSYVARYEDLTPTGNGVLRELARRDIQLSVENLVVYLLHAKIFGSIQRCHARSDRRLLKRFQEIYASKMTICQLGAQAAFADFTLSDELALELVSLPNLQCPLAVVRSLVRSVDLIHEGLNHSILLTNLAGRAGLVDGERVSICSDDLIATFVHALAQVRPANLFSLSKYLEMFGWSSYSRDRPAYCTATFQLVVQYVFNYTGESTHQMNCSMERFENDEEEADVDSTEDDEDDNGSYCREIILRQSKLDAALEGVKLNNFIDSASSLRESTSSCYSSHGDGSLRSEWDDI